ncbi:YlmC/YmxH family sporulation protein [Bacillus sp. V59.32b]|uniref:YlmC/YmxH family sporulation protein n=1 Tax=Bacillus sp. V59.32b TaxID=1758642 RepID=UPI000E3DE74F|nr:YlmC/YmxH family sporulation protein [Bacillus sp. V59.32b]RFU68779.1 YlmC/YmxH family sporulation protein [Bacillus sp. V59.32b]
MLKISEFQVKDIVNVSDGKKLGSLADLDINLSTGAIEAIIVSDGSKLMGIFSKEADIIIPWHRIKKIGADVILVDYNTPNKY